MCFFTDDYDWYASVQDEAEAETGPATRCMECNSPISENDWRRTVHQQEHEECQICIEQDEQSDDHDHDYGETFDYVVCRACDRLLLAIEKREELNGCPDHARRPGLGELGDSLYETSERREYAEFAVQMFPDLATHPFVVAAAG